MDPSLLVELSARGGDGSGHVSRPVDMRQLEWADVILTATAEHRRELLRRYPSLATRLFTLEQFLDGAERAGGADPVVPAALTHRRPARPDDDLIDPIGDARAAARCARIADRQLQRLAGLLEPPSAQPGATVR